jgi:hypothetical protein
MASFQGASRHFRALSKKAAAASGFVAHFVSWQAVFGNPPSAFVKSGLVPSVADGCGPDGVLFVAVLWLVLLVLVDRLVVADVVVDDVDVRSLDVVAVG